jgi:hypothetical protein
MPLLVAIPTRGTFMPGLEGVTFEGIGQLRIRTESPKGGEGGSATACSGSP